MKREEKEEGRGEVQKGGGGGQEGEALVVIR